MFLNSSPNPSPAQYQNDLPLIEPSNEPAYEPWGDAIPGIARDIAYFLYNSAPHPLVEGAIAGAIAYLAGIVGRAYNVGGMGLNQYVVLLAETGMGKNASAASINTLDNAVEGMLVNTGVAVRRGPSSIVSPQGLIKALAGTDKIEPKLCCLSLLDEVGYMFQDICRRDAHANEKGIQTAMLKLYTASGGKKRFGDMAYSDVQNNVKAVIAPAWSFLGNSTQQEFYKAVDERTIASGVIGRLTLFEYPKDQPRPKHNWQFNSVRPNLDLINRLSQLMIHAKRIEDTEEWINVPFDQAAHNANYGLEEEVSGKMQHFSANGESYLVGIWTRVREKVLRLAALLAVGVNPENPLITTVEIDAAYRIILRGTVILTARFRSGMVGDSGYQHEQYDLMLKCIHSYIVKPWSPQFEKSYLVTKAAKDCAIIHYQYLNANLRTRPPFKNAPNMKMAFDNTIKQFMDAGKLILLDKQDPIRNGRTGSMYRVVGL